MDAKEIIARRVAQEVKPEMLVNLGIGLPSSGRELSAEGHACVLPGGERRDRPRPPSA